MIPEKTITVTDGVHRVGIDVINPIWAEYMQVENERLKERIWKLYEGAHVSIGFLAESLGVDMYEVRALIKKRRETAPVLKSKEYLKHDSQSHPNKEQL